MSQETDLYRRIFSKHPDATVLFGLIDGRIEDVNDAALALYGYDRDEMVGMQFAALSAEPEAKVHKRKDGSMMAIESRHSTMNLDGREVGVSVIRELSALRVRPEAADLHDILAAILGLTERSIKALAETVPAREDLEEIRIASLRAAKLTRQLMGEEEPLKV